MVIFQFKFVLFKVLAGQGMNRTLYGRHEVPNATFLRRFLTVLNFRPSSYEDRSSSICKL